MLGEFGRNIHRKYLNCKEFIGSIMASIFELLNTHEDFIIAAVTIVLGTLEIGASSWGIHRLVKDEHFAYFVLGYLTHNNNAIKNLPELMYQYPNLISREDVKEDLLDTMFLLKIAFGLGIFSGILEISGATTLILFRKARVGRVLVTGLGGLSLMGLAAGFVLVLLYIIPNVIYFQVFLATSGVNFVLLLHLLGSIVLEEVFKLISTKFPRRRSQRSKSNRNESQTQTPSVAMEVADFQEISENQSRESGSGSASGSNAATTLSSQRVVMTTNSTNSHNRL